MIFSPYLYFSFVLVCLFAILEVAKNFKHSLLLKTQFIGLLSFAGVVNLFLFKGSLSELELSVVRLLIDIMPMFVLNIALVLYAYKLPSWVFIVEGSAVLIGTFLILFTTNSPTSSFLLRTHTFNFYAVASTANKYMYSYRILLLGGYFLIFSGFIIKTTFFDYQKNQFYTPLRFWTTVMILIFLFFIFENTLPIHEYTKGVYSTHILPVFLALGVLYRPESINIPWYHYDLASGIKKVEISKDSFEIAFYSSKFYLKEKANIENLSIELDSDKIVVTAFIKKNTGLGFADLMNKSRVDYLVSLLKEGQHHEFTIEALAKMSGFGSRQTMYKAFAKFKKQSPTDFIESLNH